MAGSGQRGVRTAVQATYASLGLEEAPYKVYERFFP